MLRPGWYLLAYDIADPRRLRRLHRAVRAEALAVQRSVFLVYGTQAEVERLLDRLETLMDPREDDLRAYPVAEPDTLWMTGEGAIHGPLLGDGPAPTLTDTPALVSDWRACLNPSSARRVAPPLREERP